MRAATAALALAAIALAGCGGGSGASSTASSTTASTTITTSTTITDYARPPASTSSAHATPAPTATLARGFHPSSPAVGVGGRIPSRYTCDGTDVSLPLRFSGVPPGAKELVLVMRDPDAPSGNFVHWSVAGIPPRTTQLPAGGVPGQIIPGRNSFGSLGYKGPCPPRGEKPHHYVITLNALGSRSGLKPGFTADQLQTAAIGVATLIGTYQRH